MYVTYLPQARLEIGETRENEVWKVRKEILVRKVSRVNPAHKVYPVLKEWRVPKDLKGREARQDPWVRPAKRVKLEYQDSPVIKGTQVKRETRDRRAEMDQLETRVKG